MGLSSTPILINELLSGRAVPWEQRGAATAGFQFSRTMGGTLGVIVLSAVVQRRLVAEHVAAEAIDGLLHPGAVITGSWARLALASALHGGFGMIAMFGAISLIAAFAFPRAPAFERRAGVQTSVMH